MVVVVSAIGRGCGDEGYALEVDEGAIQRQ
jgi:hypothetical protein